MRDSFVFYKSYYEAIELLPKSQRADAYRAIFELMFNGNDITDELPNTAKAIFLMAKPTLEASNKKYEAGKKGAEAKKVSKSQANDKQPDKQNGSNVNVNVNENVNVEEKEKKEKNKKEKKESLLDRCKSDPSVKMLLDDIGKDEEFLKELISYRRKIKPFKSELGVKGVLKNLANTSIATGKSVDELFEVMQEREWMTIQADYLQSPKQSPSKSQAKPDIVEANRQAAMQAVAMMRQKEVANG